MPGDMRFWSLGSSVAWETPADENGVFRLSADASESQPRFPVVERNIPMSSATNEPALGGLQLFLALFDDLGLDIGRDRGVLVQLHRERSLALRGATQVS